MASPSSDSFTVVSSGAVRQALAQLSLSDFLDSQTAAFRSFSSPTSSISAPTRIALGLANHTTLFMPARAKDVGGSACKIVSVPSRADDVAGLPAMTVVLDDDTGRVQGVVNASELTGVRTAAGSVVASRLLLGEGKDQTRLVVFGAGVQSFCRSHRSLSLFLSSCSPRSDSASVLCILYLRFAGHVHLHLLQFPTLTHVSVLAQPSRTAPYARLSTLLAQLSTHHPTTTFTHSCTPSFDREKAVRQADLILCCTPSTEALFPSEWVRSGTHLSLIGSYKPHMREVSDDLLARAGVVFVDGLHETRIEAGELQAWEGPVVEVGSVVDDPLEARQRWSKGKGDVTVWKSVGLAVQDVAITALVFRKACELGLGQAVDFY